MPDHITSRTNRYSQELANGASDLATAGEALRHVATDADREVVENQAAAAGKALIRATRHFERAIKAVGAPKEDSTFQYARKVFAGEALIRVAVHFKQAIDALSGPDADSTFQYAREVFASEARKGVVPLRPSDRRPERGRGG
jgi:hypothetical protein